MWDEKKAVAYLNSHAHEHSLGRCAEFVRKAIEAGGIHLVHHVSAKDYGGSLEQAMFKVLPAGLSTFTAGDVAVIQPIPGHPHGHMTMFNGGIWISDFKQRYGLYPGESYRKLKPPYKVYRYFMTVITPTVMHLPGSVMIA